MGNEELEAELLRIEEEIKKICSQFHEIFQRHGIGAGEQNNFWHGINSLRTIYDSKTIKLGELLERWSEVYAEKARVLSRYNYVERIRKLTNQLYSEDIGAENIVRRLSGFSKGNERKYGKILGLLEQIKAQCRKLMIVAKSLQKLIDELPAHAAELDRILQSETDLERLKDSEYEYAGGIRKRMIRIGKMGWRIASKIYSEDKKAEHIFKKIRRQMLS